jgi:sulfite reductase alpha subunit-like flavoprotein
MKHGSSSSGSEDLNPEKVLILFASETGNAQDTAERVGREIRRKGGRCTVLSMEDFDIVCPKFLTKQLDKADCK